MLNNVRVLKRVYYLMRKRRHRVRSKMNSYVVFKSSRSAECLELRFISYSLLIMSHLQYYAYPGFGEKQVKDFSYSQAVRVGDRIECAGQGN